MQTFNSEEIVGPRAVAGNATAKHSLRRPAEVRPSVPSPSGTRPATWTAPRPGPSSRGARTAATASASAPRGVRECPNAPHSHMWRKLRGAPSPFVLGQSSPRRVRATKTRRRLRSSRGAWSPSSPPPAGGASWLLPGARTGSFVRNPLHATSGSERRSCWAWNARPTGFANP